MRLEFSARRFPVRFFVYLLERADVTTALAENAARGAVAELRSRGISRRIRGIAVRAGMRAHGHTVGASNAHAPERETNARVYAVTYVAAATTTGAIALALVTRSMHKVPRLEANGHVEVEGSSYRVVERPDDGGYDVVRDSDGAMMGSFAFPEGGDVTSSFSLMEGAFDAELVRRVAGLLATPRGLLPIQ